MESRTATREATREVLVFVIGKEEYGVDILKVQEIRGYEKVTPIPAAPEYLKGVLNLRGVIVPVIDMRVKFSLPEPRYDSTTVVVILKLASRVIGIVVDAVSDVVRLAPADVKEAPRLGSIVDAGYLSGVATRDERMILLLDIEKFLSSGELDLLEAAAREPGAT
ncbi:MAG TPA: chemotaxis protein CheW [Usitatibacter sp.]|nr:chemotaxis protein CheW [Usitatibacter sp.]